MFDMNAQDPELLAMLKKHEGWRPHAYEDSEGYLTIGYGTLIDKRRGGGITEAEGEMLLANRADGAVGTARMFTNGFDGLSENRQRVLVDMAYNLGGNGFSKFKKMHAAIEAGDFDKAAHEMLDSRWARQVGQRAITLSQMMKQG